MTRWTAIKAAAILMLSGSSEMALAATEGWRISEASGKVSVLRAGRQTVAARGGTLMAGDIVQTGAGGRAVMARDEEFVVVAPNSRLQIPGEDRTGFTRFVQEVGNAIFKVRKRATQHFSVETPYLAAVVKGTTFSITVDENGSSVQVVEGMVEVSTLDGASRELLGAGDIAAVDGDDMGRLMTDDIAPSRPSALVATRLSPAPCACREATVPLAGSPWRPL